jgi:hypothetical protein
MAPQHHRVLGRHDIGLADQHRSRGMPGDHPAPGQVPPLHLPVPQRDVRRAGQVETGSLPVPHLPTRVPADGLGTPASFSAWVIRGALCPASRWLNIRVTTGAVSGSGSRRCARLPHPAWALFGCDPASPSPVPVRRTPAEVPALVQAHRCSAISCRILSSTVFPPFPVMGSWEA